MIPKKLAENFDWQSRRFYLKIADEDYLGARVLCLSGIYLPAGVLAQQAVEKYMKLKLIELNDKTDPGGHDLLLIFRYLIKQKVKIKGANHYKDLLTQLTNSFKFKYFDHAGLLGAIRKKYRRKPVTTGLGKGLLIKFDELCMELRNSLTSSDSGGTPVNMAMNSIKKSSRGEHNNLGRAFYTENKYAHSFKENTTAQGRGKTY